jgi:uncharacterized protein YciI
MHYILFYSFVEEILERRTPYREEHLALAKEAHARGELSMAGAFAEPTDGAALIFRTDDIERVKDFVTRDPYVSNGLVTQWHIRPWHVAIGA